MILIDFGRDFRKSWKFFLRSGGGGSLGGHGIFAKNSGGARTPPDLAKIQKMIGNGEILPF